MSVKRGKLYPAVDFSYAANQYGLDEVEWERITERLGRAPNDIECSIFAALWSEEYCRKSSAALLDKLRQADPRVKKTAGNRLGSISLFPDYEITACVAANNQQTYYDARLGSQTAMDMACLELCALGAEPLAVFNMLRLGPAEQIASQQLLQQAVIGSSDFSNRSGLPILGGELYFHPQYKLGAIMNSAAIGLVHKSSGIKPEAGKRKCSIVYVGAKTSPEAKVRGKAKKAVSIRVADPVLADRLLAACQEAMTKGLLFDLVSVAVGGLATACFDLAAKLSAPIRLDLDRIPTKIEGLGPKDILLTESSERILAVAEHDAHRALREVFQKYDLEATVVGQPAEADGLEIYWNHYQIADIPYHFAMGGSIQKHFKVVKFPPMLKRTDNAQVSDSKLKKRKVQDEWAVVRESANKEQTEVDEISRSASLEDSWLDLLANPNLCSRRPIYSLSDQQSGLRAVLSSGGDAAVIRLLDGSQRGLAASIDSNSLYVGMDPYLGTVQSVAEAMRNLACAGAEPLGLSYCLNFGDPNRYKEVCDLSESIRGLADACKIWNIPILAENVSLFNGSESNPILPAPAIMLVGAVENVETCRSIEFKSRDDLIFLLGTTLNELGCSEYGFYCHHQINRLVPDINFDLEKRSCKLIIELLKQGLIESAHDLSLGGLAMAFAECCLGGERPVGATLELSNTLEKKEFREDAFLFSESSARFLISCKAENETAVRELCLKHMIPITGQGKVGGRELRIEGPLECALPLQTAYKIWLRRMDQLLQTTKAAA